MLKIAICDDEKIFIEKIKKSINNTLDYWDIFSEIDMFDKGNDLLNKVNEENYDVLFLDIELGTENGIELAKKIRERGYKGIIVFITSFVDYSLLGYKVDAFRYILKINFEAEMDECIKSLIEKLSLKTIKYGNISISIRDLMYIESWKRKVIFNLFNGKKFEAYGKLDQVEQLFDSTDLLRIHQSFLVNQRYIEKIERYKVVLKNQKELPIPKAKFKNIENKVKMWNALWE